MRIADAPIPSAFERDGSIITMKVSSRRNIETFEEVLRPGLRGGWFGVP